MDRKMKAHYAIHPAHIRLRRAAWKERAALVRALGIEMDWLCHNGPEWAGRYWDAFGDLERTRDRDFRAQAQIDALARHRGRPACPRADADRMRALFRHLLACLHPEVNPGAAHDTRAEQWQRVSEAYRRGDLDALKHMARQVNTRAYANGLRMPMPLLQREFRRLCSARKAVDHRLTVRSRQFPYCLRDKLDDPAWVARQRRIWRHMIKVAAPERLPATLPSADMPWPGREGVC